MGSRKAGRQEIMQPGGISEILQDIQIKMKRQEEESLELKEQVARLEEHNAQLREANGMSQQECEQLRREIEILQQNQLQRPSSSDVSDQDSQLNRLPLLPTWQQETQRLRSQVLYLEEECQRLRTQLKTSNSSGCCCFQLCKYLFGNNATNGTVLENDFYTRPAENPTTAATATNYYTNHAILAEN